MKRFQTATLSHDEIRMRLWRALDEGCPGTPGEYASWPVLGDVYDGFCIAKATIDGKYGLFKFPYTVGENDAIALGEPVDLLAADRGKLSGSVNLVASNVLTGDDAQEMVEALAKNNTLFARIKGSPNTNLVVFDLTSVGRPSKHAGKWQYQLAKAGLAAAIPTLISKPIHVTPGLDGHMEAGKSPVAIGAFLGAEGLENEDGTMTVRAIGTLWDSDFPEIVAEIQSKKAQLGASYEIAYLAASADRIGDKLIEIKDYQFSGGAILKKSAAAHPETQLLLASHDDTPVYDVMDEEDLPRLLAYVRGATSFTQADKLSYDQRQNLKDSDFALVQTVDGKKIRRFPIHDEAHRKNAWARLPQAKNLSDAERAEVANKIMSKAKSAGDDWAKPYKKSNGTWTKDTKEGGASMKYQGIPAEHEAAVDAIVAALKAEMKAEQDKAIAELKAAMPEFLKEKEKKKEADAEAEAKLVEAGKVLEAEKGKVVELTNQVTALTASVDGVKAELVAKTTQLAEIETKAKLAETAASLKADYGLTDEQLKEPKRAELMAKLAAAKEPLSVAEFKELISGGKVTAGKGQAPVPLFAGGGDPNHTAPDKDAIARAFPAATRVMFR